MERIVKARLIVAFIAVATLSTWASERGCQGPSLDRVIEHFDARGSLAENIVRLGRQSAVCFALRALDERAFEPQAAVSFSKATLGSVLDHLIRPLSGYSHRQSGMIIEIGRLTLITQASPLERAVTFRAGRAAMRAILNGVAMQVAVDQDPSITGFAGSFLGGDVTDVVGPIDERGRPLSRLLGQIIGQSKGSVWIAAVPEDAPARVSPFYYWKLIEYDASDDFASLILSETASSLSCHEKAARSEQLSKQPVKILDIRQCALSAAETPKAGS